MKAKGIILRIIEENKQTLGRFYLFSGLDLVFSCAVLELPDRSNQKNISRVCSGVYVATLRYSKKFRWHYHLQDVEGRELILIHFGNYYTDIEGCILFGNQFTDINGDGLRDVTSSKKTMRKLLAVAPPEFELTIQML